MRSLATFSKNAAMLLVARAVDLLFSIAMVAVITRYFGAEVYGQYAVLMAVVLTLTSMAHLGIPKIVIREIAKNHDSASHFLGASLILSGSMFPVVVLAAGVASLFLNLDSSLSVALWLAIAAELLHTLAGSFGSVFLARERMELDATVTLSMRLVFFAILLFVVLNKLGLTCLFFSMLVANALALILAATLCWRSLGVWPALGASRQTLRHLFTEAIPVGATFILLQFLQYVDVFVLKLLRGFEDVAFFQAPYVLVCKSQYVGRIVILSLAPILARMVLSENRCNLGPLYTTLAKYALFASLPVSLFGLFFRNELVTLFFGEAFLPAAAVFSVIVWSVPLIIVDLISDVTLVSMGKQKLVLAHTFAGLVLNTILDFALIPHYGSTGAGLASLTALAFVFLLNLRLVWQNAPRVNVFKIFCLPLLLAGGASSFGILLAPLGTVISLLSVSALYVMSMWLVFRRSGEEWSLLLLTIRTA